MPKTKNNYKSSSYNELMVISFLITINLNPRKGGFLPSDKGHCSSDLIRFNAMSEMNKV